MPSRIRLGALAIVLLVTQLSAPARTFGQTPAAPEDDRVVQLGVTLVQVDAVVTDKDGRQVTDLKADDFEVLEDGKPQAVTDCSYVTNASASARVATSSSAAPGPASAIRAEDVRRTIVVVVDAMPFEDTAYARSSLRKFIERDMQPGDLISIVQSHAGARSVQSFTSDKRTLLAAVERIKWNPFYTGADTGALVTEEPGCDGAPMGIPARDAASTAPYDDGAAYRAESFTNGTLGLLGTVTASLRDLPGRKAIILLSAGSESGAGRCFYRFERGMNALVDAASRAAVGIYAVDVRGLVNFSPGANESTSDLVGRGKAMAESPGAIGGLISQRSSSFFHSQDVLAYIAQRTGGEFLHNNNDVAGEIRRAANDQNGYYLLAYRPDDTTFAEQDGGRTFHTLDVRAKRSGLRVRSRAGFIGVTDDEVRARPTTPAQELARAIRSPFGADGVHVALNPVFISDATAGPTVDAMIHFDARDLTFDTKPDGTHATSVDVVVVLLDEYGAIRDTSANTHTLTLQPDVYQKALDKGIDFAVAFPTKKSGAYQVRAAVRDTASRRVGSTSWSVDVPNLGKHRLAASSILLGGAGGVTPTASTLRQFHLGAPMQYVVDLYNVKPDAGRFHYTTKLYRDGALVYEGAPSPVELPAGSDGRMQIGKALTLSPAMTAGSYVLEVSVVDARAGKNDKPLTRWIDFDVE